VYHRDVYFEYFRIWKGFLIRKTCFGRPKMAKGKDKGNVNEKKKPTMTIKEKRKAKKEKHAHE